MRVEEIKEQISKLDLAEQLLLVEDVWDAIAVGNSALPMPDWQKHEMDRRYQEYQQGTLELHDWRTVHEALREKYK